MDKAKNPKRCILIALVSLGLLVALICSAAGRSETEVGKKKVEIDKKELEVKFEKRITALEKEVQKLKNTPKAKPTPKKVAATQPKTPIQPAVVYPVGCEQYKPLVAQYSWDVDVAMAVMFAESGCNPNAVSRTNDHGLFQINWIHSAKVGGDLNKLYNPQINVAIAYQIYSDSGWTPWSVCGYNVNCY